MCMLLASAGMAMIQTAEQIKAQNQNAANEAKAANEAALSDYKQEQEQQNQINQQYQLEGTERERQALRERGRLMVAMGEAGVSGNTPLREVANSYLQESYDMGIMDTNRQNKINQNEVEKQGIYNTAKGRINQAKSQVVNPFMGALMIGASGLNGYMSGLGMQNALVGPGNTSTTHTSGYGNLLPLTESTDYKPYI